MKSKLYRFWLQILASFRLSSYAICEMSKNLDHWNDYHDYPDSIEGQPWHMTELTCKRCGKKFVL